jgi:FAD synthetase
MNRRVLIFGTFDGVHEGHRFLLREAKKLGERLIVVVARDVCVQRLKGKNPTYREGERRKRIQEEAGVDVATLGDAKLGRYRVLKTMKPDAIALGYDQDALRTDLKRWMRETHNRFPLVSIKRYVGPTGRKC